MADRPESQPPFAACNDVMSRLQQTMRRRQEAVERAAQQWDQFVQLASDPSTPQTGSLQPDPWGRFRQRLMQGNQQARYLREWRRIKELTELPVDQSAGKLRTMVSPEQMDESSFQYFRNALTLVNAAYMNRAGLVGITDPAEWERRYQAFVSGPDPDAVRYQRFLELRMELERIRKPQDQQVPYSPEELNFSSACNALFNRVALAMNQTGPVVATPEVIEELQSLIGEHSKLLSEARPENRARRQARQAIAELKYATARAYLNLPTRDYQSARQYYYDALSDYEALGDQKGAQCARQQLAALVITQTGDVDAAMQANLRALTGEKRQGRSLDRAKALVERLTQCISVGDKFQANKLLEQALAELRVQLYLDPNLEQIEPKFLSQWIESVPPELEGNDFFQELAYVLQLYAAVYGARANTWTEPRNATRAIEQLSCLRALVNRMGAESLSADAELQGQFAATSARPLAPEGDVI